MKRVFITTTDTIEGAKIVEYKGLVSSNIVAGTGFLSDFVAGLSDFFGGRSGTYRRQMEAIYSEALDDISFKATQVNANAVIGFKIDFDSISAKGMSMFMISITGTAVVADLSALNGAPIPNSNISLFLLEAELRKRRIISILARDQYLDSDEWSLILFDAQDDYSKALSDYIVRSEHDPDRLSPDRERDKEYFSKYIDRIDEQSAINVVYPLIDVIPGFAHHVIEKCQLFDARSVLALLEKGLISDACEILNVYKKSYSKEDVQMMKMISERLHNLPIIGKTEVVKSGLFSKESNCFICPEGHVNDIETVFCKKCGKNAQGLTKKEVELINDFDEIIEALDNLFSLKRES